MSRKPSTDQYVLDFQSRRNDLYALINGIQQLPDTVRDLLKLLIAVTPVGTSLDGDKIMVRGSVNYLGGKMIGFRTVTGRTIRTWRAQAVALGVLSVEIAHGYRRWNVCTIHVDAIKNYRKTESLPVSPLPVSSGISSGLFRFLPPNTECSDTECRDISLRDHFEISFEDIQDDQPYQSFTSTESEEPDPIPPQLENPMTTWMTPYAEIWLAVFGGKMACKQAAKSLKELQETHGALETIKRWQNYCESHRGQGEFASAAKFSQTFGQWKDASATDKSRRIDRSDETIVQQVYDPKKHGPWNPITGVDDNVGRRINNDASESRRVDEAENIGVKGPSRECAEVGANQFG